MTLTYHHLPPQAPELFLHYLYYDYSVDLWALGCMVGSIIFQRYPMFYGKVDSLTQVDRKGGGIVLNACWEKLGGGGGGGMKGR